MKIALLTDAMFPHVIGGIQKHSYLLVKYLVRQSFTVDVYHSKIIKDIDLHNHFTDMELSKINFIDFKYPNTYKFPGHYIYTSYKLSKLYYKNLIGKNYNLIYAQGFMSWFTLKKEPFKLNLVTNLHGLEMFQHKINFKETLKHSLLKIPAKYIIRRSVKQISLGGKLTDILNNQSALKGSIIEIPNAIEEDWIKSGITNRNSKKLKFVFIGRYERRKGVEELTEVLKELILIYDFEFHFIGPIPDLNKINNKKIIYHGMVKNQNKIKSILVSSDALVCPSYSEGMPTVILEAMACGNAIIATNVGATSMLVDETNGFLISKNNAEELKKALIKFFNLSSDLKDTLGQSSILKVKENFTWEKVIDLHFQLFNKKKI